MSLLFAEEEIVAATKETKKMNPSVIKEAETFVKWASDLGVPGLIQYFRTEINSINSPGGPSPSFDSNMEKNRYRDVPCIEETRVKLKQQKPEDGDYIHANWVRFHRHKRTYIATQGPMDNTIEDFWRMVWQEQSPVVINLTKCCEDGKAKCAQYWPETKKGARASFGRFTIALKKVEVDEINKLFIYALEMQQLGSQDTHELTLIHTLAWRDGEGMHSSNGVLRLLLAMYKEECPPDVPVIVHCSAGIGRTGTLMLVDYILTRIFKGKSANVADAFIQMRKHRASTILKEQQFVSATASIWSYIAYRLPEYAKGLKLLEEEIKKTRRA